MKKNPDISFLLIPNHDGITTAFPVSKHVLDTSKTNLREEAIYGKVRRAIPTLARPATSLAILLCVWTVSLGNTYAGSSTLAYFRDTEESVMNVIGAGALNFDLNPGEVTVSISADSPILISPRMIPENETFPVTYRISTELVSEPNTFCSRLQATGTTSPYLYSGQLLSLTTEPATTTGYGHVEVSVSDPADLIAGMQCTVDIVYRGWHSNVPEDTGYSDEERDRFTFVFDAPVEVAALVESEVITEEPEEVVPPEEPAEQLEEPQDEIVELTPEVPVTEEVVTEETPAPEETPEEAPIDEPVPSEEAPEPIVETEPTPEPDAAPEPGAESVPTE